MAQRIYLDYNATAPIRPEVIELMCKIMDTVGNASSVHEPGRQARQRVETARQQVANLVSASVKNVIFTDVFAHVLPPKAEIPLFSLCFCNAENVQKPL